MPGLLTEPLPSLSDVQGALDARYTEPGTSLYIGGALLPYRSISGNFSAGQTGTGRILMPLPKPPEVVANAPVVLEGGHNDLRGVMFRGYVRRWEYQMTPSGDMLNITIGGLATRMHEPLRRDITFRGPVRAEAVFAAICDATGVEAYIAEEATFPDGSWLTLGGNPQVDDGKITIKAHSSPFSQFQRLVSPYGYDLTDRTDGPVRFHKLSGTPNTEPVVTFRERVHLGTSRRTYDPSDIVNAWRVIGQTYEDTLGGTMPIESIAVPGDVPAHEEIVGGFRYREERIGDIVRQDQAEAIRARYEMDFAEAQAPIQWDGVAVPGLSVGDVVRVVSPTLDVDQVVWLIEIDYGDDDGGFFATYTGWAGTGEARESLLDRTTRVIDAGPVHLGDEYVSHYAQNSPVGVVKAWPFTLPERASAVNVRGYAHSWNSQTVAGEDTDLTVSRWEIWPAGVDYMDEESEERPEASGTMPQMPEMYYSGIEFDTFGVDASLSVGAYGRVTNPGAWAPFAIPMKSLEAGDYVLVFKCGKGEGYDDGEVRELYLEIWGATEAAGYEEAS